MKITIPGPPIPQARPKFSSRGRFVKAYDPKQKIKDNQKIALFGLANDQNGFNGPTGFPISLKLFFSKPIAPSDTSSTKNAKLWGIQLPCQRSGDIDNLCKWILDLANGILWDDDSQIVELNARQVYSADPCTIIEFEEIINIMNESAKKLLSVFSPKELEALEESLCCLMSGLHDFRMETNETIKRQFIDNFAEDFIVFIQDLLPKFKKLVK